MCDALMELMKDELEESKRQGIEQGIKQIIRNALRKGYSPEQISDFIDVSLEEVLAVQLVMAEGAKNEMVYNVT